MTHNYYHQLPNDSTTKQKNKTLVQAKAMALVLSVAFIVSASAAAVVSLLVKNYCKPAATTAIVTKNQADTPPEKNTAIVAGVIDTGNVKLTPIFSAVGITARGNQWTYRGDSDCALIHCVYDSDSMRYIFSAEGVHAGTDHVQLIYKLDDKNWETRSVTLYVDDNLNVSVSQEKS